MLPVALQFFQVHVNQSCTVQQFVPSFKAARQRVIKIKMCPFSIPENIFSLYFLCLGRNTRFIKLLLSGG
jgi:hypothetical protein